MIDFDAAEAKGMALRIPLTDEQARCGFERLVVVGIKASLDAEASARRLAGLLDAHHYTNGLAIVPQNVATNNTADASSGYTSSAAARPAATPSNWATRWCRPGPTVRLRRGRSVWRPPCFLTSAMPNGTEQGLRTVREHGAVGDSGQSAHETAAGRGRSELPARTFHRLRPGAWAVAGIPRRQPAVRTPARGCRSIAG